MKTIRLIVNKSNNIDGSFCYSIFRWEKAYYLNYKLGFEYTIVLQRELWSELNLLEFPHTVTRSGDLIGDSYKVTKNDIENVFLHNHIEELSCHSDLILDLNEDYDIFDVVDDFIDTNSTHIFYKGPDPISLIKFKHKEIEDFFIEKFKGFVSIHIRRYFGVQITRNDLKNLPYEDKEEFYRHYCKNNVIYIDGWKKSNNDDKHHFIPDSHYYFIIEKILDLSINQKFYISTDLPLKYYQYYKERYRNIYDKYDYLDKFEELVKKVHPGNLLNEKKPRFNIDFFYEKPEQIVIGNILDLFALANSKLIVRPNSSNWSKVALRVNNTKQIVLPLSHHHFKKPSSDLGLKKTIRVIVNKQNNLDTGIGNSLMMWAQAYYLNYKLGFEYTIVLQRELWSELNLLEFPHTVTRSGDLIGDFRKVNRYDIEDVFLYNHTKNLENFNHLVIDDWYIFNKYDYVDENNIKFELNYRGPDPISLIKFKHKEIEDFFVKEFENTISIHIRRFHGMIIGKKHLKFLPEKIRDDFYKDYLKVSSAYISSWKNLKQDEYIQPFIPDSHYYKIMDQALSENENQKFYISTDLPLKYYQYYKERYRNIYDKYDYLDKFEELVKKVHPGNILNSNYNNANNFYKKPEHILLASLIDLFALANSKLIVQAHHSSWGKVTKRIKDTKEIFLPLSTDSNKTVH